MAWETPKTWSDTEDRLNSANLNRFVRDNQLALREEAAGLGQRLSLLEVAGFGDAQLLTVGFTEGVQRIYTNLSPPSNCKLIYLAVRGEPNARWTAVPLIDYAIWNALPEIAAVDSFDGYSADGWGFAAQAVTSMQTQEVIIGAVGKGTGGVLFFWCRFGNMVNRRYDRVCLRWYT